jgi:hypothetical protein
MRSRKSPVEYVGPALGLVALALTAFALVYLLWIRPFYRAGSYAHGPWGAQWSAPWGAGWERREETRRVDERVEALSVHNVSGPVRVSGWDEDYVQITYVKQARSAAALEEFRIEIAQRGGELSVQPLYRGAGPRAVAAFGSVSFDIRVPAAVRRVEVRNVSGSIELENLEAGVRQDLQTVSGSIRTQRSADLRAESISGSIDFVFAGAELSAQSTSGRIGGRILGIEEGGRVRVQSISGAVDLEAFADLSAELDLSSASGSISCDFPMQVREQKRTNLQATVGSGAVPFRVQTVSGSIRLHR